MNGKRLLLDTNAVVALLQGNQYLVQLCRDAEWVGISIISQIEFLCFSGLTAEDRDTFRHFLTRVEVVSLESENSPLLDLVVATRQRGALKLPDAIIAAASLWREAVLVTADRAFAGFAGLQIQDF